MFSSFRKSTNKGIFIKIIKKIKWLIASDYDINSKIIELLFCLSFGLCVMALELFIFEIFQIDTESFRLKLWQYTLASLGLLILYIIPEVLFYKMT